MNHRIEVRRLASDDVDLEERALKLIADVFEEPSRSLPDVYVASLLSRAEFWAHPQRGDRPVHL